MNADDDYNVGYGKPPKRSQFKPGVSGCPTGRPKRDPDWLDLFDAEFKVRVPLSENGRKRRLQKKTLIVKQIVNGAIKGERASLRIATEVMAALDARSAARTEPLSAKERAAMDRAILDQITASLAAVQTEPGEDET